MRDRETSDHEQRALRVEGRVQGVGFRWWTAKTAEALGVRGWVRNLPDGAVEVHLSGEAATLEEFQARLREGPGPARVERIVELGGAGELPPAGFVIRR